MNILTRIREKKNLVNKDTGIDVEKWFFEAVPKMLEIFAEGIREDVPEGQRLRNEALLYAAIGRKGYINVSGIPIDELVKETKIAQINKRLFFDWLEKNIGDLWR